jgi:outer membrane beta-barrel protein
MTHAKHLMPLIAALALPLAQPNLALAQDEGGDDAEVSAEAQKTQDAEPETEQKKKLSDRIKSVQRKVFLKRKRVEVFPYFGLDLNDPFYQHFVVGGSVGFHIADSMSVELRGGGVIGSVKQDAIKFVRQETGSLIVDPPQFKANVDLDFAWAPFYGKISLLGEGILHFDTYITAGPGIFATDAGINPAMNVGLGQRYFINDWLVTRVELRDYLFIDTRNGTSDLQNLLMLTFSVSGFFPMSFEYEFQ